MWYNKVHCEYLVLLYTMVTDHVPEECVRRAGDAGHGRSLD